MDGGPPFKRASTPIRPFPNTALRTSGGALTFLLPVHPLELVAHSYTAATRHPD